MSSKRIVDYVQIVTDDDGQYRVRGMADNHEIVWTTEKYGDHAWALAVALDTGRPLFQSDAPAPAIEPDVDV